MDAEEILHDIPPYLKVYKDGTIQRLLGTEISPATPDDHKTGVSSKDIIFHSENALSVRLYRPKPPTNHEKLPLVIYFPGGAFIISSTSDPKYHDMLNLLVKQAKIILVSVNYRLAPEYPLPAAYEDSWEAIEWINSHALGGDDGEVWLKEFVDFEKVFLAGDSSGANISHHMAIKAGVSELRFKISGILMVHPYFWSEEAIGIEKENPILKEVVDAWWNFVCQSEKGCDDPLINPFTTGGEDLAGLACDRIIVFVAGNDILRERGKFYYEAVKNSKWEGQVELFVTDGEDHVFHIIDSTSPNSIQLVEKCAKFVNKK